MITDFHQFKYEFHLKANGVGHHFPTGDVFRHITLEVALSTDEDFRVVHKIGRVFKQVKNPSTENIVQELIKDSSLDPFEDRKILVKIKKPFRYRVVYHYTSARNEIISQHSKQELIQVLSTCKIR